MTKIITGIAVFPMGPVALRHFRLAVAAQGIRKRRLSGVSRLRCNVRGWESWPAPNIDEE